MDTCKQPTQLRTLFEAGAIKKGEFVRTVYQSHRVLFDYPEYLTGTDVESLEIRKEGIVATFGSPSLRMWCPPGEARHTALSCLDFRRYEAEEIRMMMRVGEDCRTIIDIGANAGFYSISLGKTWPDAQIYAFEPIPSTHRELRRNLILNDVTNVESFNLGLADAPGELTFYFDPTISGATSSAPLGDGFETSKVGCTVTTLDAFVDERQISPDLIKCDVEGGELKTFLGARTVLSRHTPIVFTEMLRKWAARFGYHPNELIEYFAGLGYECYFIAGEVLQRLHTMGEETAQTNFFFLHSERHLPRFMAKGLVK